MFSQDGILNSRDYGMVKAEDSRKNRSAFLELGNKVGPEFLLNALPAIPTRLESPHGSDVVGIQE